MFVRITYAFYVLDALKNNFRRVSLNLSKKNHIKKCYVFLKVEFWQSLFYSFCITHQLFKKYIWFV